MRNEFIILLFLLRRKIYCGPLGDFLDRLLYSSHWRNRGGGSPLISDYTLLTRKLLTYWEKRDNEKSENREEKKEHRKRKVENWKWKEEKLQMRSGLFFFFFFLFQNHWNLCFFTGKSISCRGKKSGKMTLPPLKNIPLTPLTLAQYPRPQDLGQNSKSYSLKT